WSPDGPRRVELSVRKEPILRYAEPASGLVEGALYVFTRGSSPEMVLLLEARKQQNAGVRWRYGLARMTGASLWVSLDGREVWAHPFGYPQAQGSYWAVPEPFKSK